MDLFELIKVVLGRWRLVVPILLVTMALAYLVQTTTPSEYEANGFLVIESPELVAGGSPAPVVDPAQVALGIQLEGDTAGRNFTVVPLGGNNYTVQAAAPTAELAEEDALSVVNTMSERIATLQEEEEVPADERVELRLVDAAVVAEEQPDGTWLASATVFLNDPTQSKTNPYLANSSTGRLLEVAFQGDAAQAEFAQRTDGEVAARVSQQARDAAPLIEVATYGTNPDAIIDGFYVVQEIMAQDLQERQERANVLPSSMLTLAELDAPLGVTDESPPVQRATAGVVVLGGLLALGLALGLEGLDRRRQQQQAYLEDLVEAGQPDPVPTPGAAEPPVGDQPERAREPTTPTPTPTSAREPMAAPAHVGAVDVDARSVRQPEHSTGSGTIAGTPAVSSATPGPADEAPAPPSPPDPMPMPPSSTPPGGDEDGTGEMNGTARNRVLEEKLRKALADRATPDTRDGEPAERDDRDWREQLIDPPPRTGPPRSPAP